MELHVRSLNQVILDYVHMTTGDFRADSSDGDLRSLLQGSETKLHALMFQCLIADMQEHNRNFGHHRGALGSSRL